jgi:hypothetical protein
VRNHSSNSAAHSVPWLTQGPKYAACDPDAPWHNLYPQPRPSPAAPVPSNSERSAPNTLAINARAVTPPNSPLPRACPATVPQRSIRAFRFKAELTIERHAHGGRVQFDPFHAAHRERLDHMLHQLPRETTPAVRGIGQHHADPRQPVFITDRRGGCRERPAVVQAEAGVRRELQQMVPIGFSLVPGRAFGQV